MSRQVKELHKYECRICGHSIQLGGGLRYAEAHHIRPLGGQHKGPDVAENLLCLCPNHHAELDYLTKPIDLNKLRNAPGHTVDEIYIDYHNGLL
jgi:predicted restriction endonuclease